MSESVEFRFVPIDSLVAPDDNIRDDVGDVSELAASIKAQGVLLPILVRKGDNLVVAGSRRLAAAKEAGLKQVPVIEREFTENERVEVMLVENLQREDLSPLEEAAAFKRLIDLGLSQRDIATKTGRARAHVQRRLSLVELPEVAKTAVSAGTITLNDAEELSKLGDDTLVEKVVKETTSTNGHYKPPVAQLVAAEVRQQGRVKLYEEKVKELKKAGENVIDAPIPEHQFNPKLPEGFRFVRERPWNLEDVEMNESRHSKLPCHAVAVHPNEATVFEVCTDSTKHTTAGEKKRKKRDAEERERMKTLAEEEAATDRRREFVRETLLKRPMKMPELKETIRLCAMALTGHSIGYGGAYEEIACDLLGLDLDSFDADVEEASWNHEDVLEIYARKGEAELARVVFALAAARPERRMMHFNSPWGDQERVYLEVLKRYGFTTAEIEEAYLNEYAEDDDENEETVADETDASEPEQVLEPEAA